MRYVITVKTRQLENEKNTRQGGVLTWASSAHFWCYQHNKDNKIDKNARLNPDWELFRCISAARSRLCRERSKVESPERRSNQKDESPLKAALQHMVQHLKKFVNPSPKSHLFMRQNSDANGAFLHWMPAWNTRHMTAFLFTFCPFGLHIDKIACEFITFKKTLNSQTRFRAFTCHRERNHACIKYIKHQEMSSSSHF